MSPEAKEEIRTIKKNTVSLILLCDKYMVLIKLCFRHFICVEAYPQRIIEAWGRKGLSKGRGRLE